MSIMIVSSNVSAPSASASSVASDFVGAADFIGLLASFLSDAKAPLVSIGDTGDETNAPLLPDATEDDPLILAEAAIPLIASEIRVLSGPLPSPPPEALDPSANSAVLLGAFPATIDLPETLARDAGVSATDAPVSQTGIDSGLTVLDGFVSKETGRRGVDGDQEEAFPPALLFENALTAKTEKAAKIADPVSAFSTSSASTPTNPDNPANSANPNPSALPTDTNVLGTPKAPEASIDTKIGGTAWAEDFSQKITWLAKNDRQSAQITLNPPELGPLEVSLNLDKRNASAIFVSANSGVRESIEMALPRLREMFAAAGIELGQAQVSAESFRQPAREDVPKPSRWAGDEAILTEFPVAQARGGISRQGMGLVDIFA
jgi:flagellar hook-length control protein FliK